MPRFLGHSLPFAAPLALLAACTSSHPRLTLHPDDPTLADLAWLTGSWTTAADAAPRTEEHWTQPSAGAMLGLSRTIAGDPPRTTFFEFLRIDSTPEGIVYLASPKGRIPPTPFRLTESGPQRAVFENPRHDFPTKISYWLDDHAQLHTRVEGPPGAKEKPFENVLLPARVTDRP
jgi:hypothetical protein